MSTIDSRTARQALVKKGFKLSESHHHFYLYYYNGKVVTKTKVSHNDQEIGNKLISKMHKQCGISKNQFLDLINCPLDEEEYIKILKEKGVINA